MNNWRKYNGALIPKTPPHIEVDTTNIEKIIKRENVFFARWTSNFDQTEPSDFWYVICDEKLDLSDYSRNTRNQIRRGLRNCEVLKINKQTVSNEGFNSYASAFSKYNTHLEAKSEEEFRAEIEMLSDEWEFWGIYNNSIMIGYSQNKVIGDYCDYSTIKFHPNYLNLYPSYALFYTMNQYYLNENSFRYVNDGARSISHQTNIQSFLIQKFKFRKAYCKLNIIYSLRIKLLLSVIYPMRFLISLLKFGPFIKINILINQEKIRRSYEERN